MWGRECSDRCTSSHLPRLRSYQQRGMAHVDTIRMIMGPRLIHFKKVAWISLLFVLCIATMPVNAMIAKNEKFTVDKVNLAQIWRFGFQQGGSLDLSLQVTSSQNAPLSFFLCTPEEVDKFRHTRVNALCTDAAKRSSMCYMHEEIKPGIPDGDRAPKLRDFRTQATEFKTSSKLTSSSDSATELQNRRSWSRVFSLLSQKLAPFLAPVYKRFQSTPLTAAPSSPYTFIKNYSKSGLGYIPNESASQKLFRTMDYFSSKTEQNQDGPRANHMEAARTPSGNSKIFKTNVNLSSQKGSSSFFSPSILHSSDSQENDLQEMYSSEKSVESSRLNPEEAMPHLLSDVHNVVLDTLLSILGDDSSSSTPQTNDELFSFVRPETTVQVESTQANTFYNAQAETYPELNWNVPSVPRTAVYSFIQLNCHDIKYKGSLSYIAVNPGGEYLSTTLIPYKTLYLVGLLGWGLLTAGWVFSWIRYMRWNTQAQKALTIPLLFRTIQSLFHLLYWRNASSKGTYDSTLYWISFLSSMLTKGATLFIFLVLAFGYGIFRSTLPTQVMKRTMVTVGLYVLGWCLFNRSMALGLYIVAFGTFLSIELCILGIVRIVRAVQEQLVLLQTIRIAPAATPLWPKVLILSKLRRLFVYLLADFFVPIWSEAFRHEGPWLGDVFDHLLHFVFMLYLCKGYLMVPFNPHYASLAKTFHLTLPAPSVTALLTALAPRVAPGAPLWSPGVPIDPPCGEPNSGYVQTAGLRMSRAAAHANLSHQLYVVNNNNGLPSHHMNEAIEMQPTPSNLGAVDDPFLRDPTRFMALPASLSMILSEREALEFAPIILRNPCPCLDVHAEGGQDPETLPHKGGVCPKQALGAVFSVLLEDKPQARRALDAVNPASRPQSPEVVNSPAAAGATADSHHAHGAARSPRSWLGLGRSQPQYHRMDNEEE